MKICNIVMDSIWYDPRVRRTIQSCRNAGLEIYAVGVVDNEYNENRVRELDFPVKLVDADKAYEHKKKNIFTVLKWTIATNKLVTKAIIETGADLIHANDLGALIPAYFARRKMKCRLVYDSHEIYTENICTGNRFKKIFWKTIENFLIKKADLVLSVSHSAAGQLAEMYKIKDPMVVTNCAFKPDHAKFADKKSDIFEVLIHGRFYEGRGYEAFVRSGRLIDHEDIQLVVRGYGELEPVLRNIAEGINNIRFDPPVLVTEMINTAAASHVGVAITEPICLNFIHSVSNKIFEYAAAGLPVIMSDIPEHRYLNDTYQFGIILEDNTPEKIAEAIMRLYSDHQLYNTLRDNAFNMTAVLNWDSEMQSLLNAYEKLVENV